MANTINQAIAYIKAPEELEKVLKQQLRTVDLEAPNKFVGGKTIRYQHIEFASSAMSAYNRATGYAANDITLTWKELTLTQDVGNSLYIDIMDDEEVMGLSIVQVVNRYINKVQSPAIDTYRFGKIISTANIGGTNATINAANIVSSVLTGKASIENAKIDTSSLILYATPSFKQLLKEAALNKGYWTLGSWNGSETEMEQFDGIKVISCPGTLLNGGKTGTGFTTNANISAILVVKEAAPAFVKYRETEYFDKIPGFGGRKAEADVGVYHDCFVYDELVDGVYVFGTLPVANS